MSAKKIAKPKYEQPDLVFEPDVVPQTRGRPRSKIRPPVQHTEIVVGHAGKLLLAQMEAVRLWRTQANEFVKANQDKVVPGRKMVLPPPPLNLIRRVADYVSYLCIARKGIDLGHGYYPFLYPVPKGGWRPYINGVAFVIKTDHLVPTRLLAVVSHWPAPPDVDYPITVSAQGSKWLLSYRGGKSEKQQKGATK